MRTVYARRNKVTLVGSTLRDKNGLCRRHDVSTAGRTVCYPVSVVAVGQRIAGSGLEAMAGPFDGAKLRERRSEGEGITAYGH